MLAYRSMMETREDSVGGREADALRGLGPGEHIGRFRVLGVLGQGSMGAVVSAYDDRLERRVAIKVLAPRDDERVSQVEARLMVEARAMARLRHDNVVTVYDAGVAGGRPFVAMEQIEGCNLRRWLQQARACVTPWRTVLRAFVKAGRGLAAAHAAGLVHRDFKPENVLVEGDRVLVADFGLAAAQGPGRTLHGDDGVATDEDDEQEVTVQQRPGVCGTPAYMAPEQHLGAVVDARADQYAFCVAVYEALYGRRPFRGRSVLELQAKILSGPVPRPRNDADVPEAVLTVLRRGLAREPRLRHASMGDLLAALEAAMRSGPVRRAGRYVASAVAGLWTAGAAADGVDRVPWVALTVGPVLLATLASAWLA